MKKFLILAAAAALAACTSPNKYVIQGQLEDFEGKLYLVNANDTATPIDSTVVENGVFRLEGEIATPAAGFLLSGPDSAREFAMRLFIEPGAITVACPDAESTPIATGTPANDASAAYYRQYIALVENFRAAATDEERGAIDAEMDQLLEQTYNANVGNVFGASLLQEQSYNLSGQELLDELAKFPEAMLAVDPLAKLKAHAEKKVRVDVGQPYIDVEQPDADGQTLTLKSVVENPANKYVLVDFWASWCGPCMREVPYLVKTYKEFHGKGFEIYGISFDTDREKWLAAVKEKELNWVHVSELNRFNCQAGSDYAVNAIPSNFLVNTADGTIVARNLRGEEVYAKIAELLAE